MAKQLILLALMVSAVGAFFVRPLAQTPGASRSMSLERSRSSVRSSRSMTVMKAEDDGYWAGEWICADCGFIYDKEEFDGTYFEDQKFGFKCPQCSAPRKRFAKKVGDKIGLTKDGGDAPIVIFSLIGGIAVIAFGIYAASGL